MSLRFLSFGLVMILSQVHPATAMATDLIIKGGMIQTSVYERDKTQPIVINGLVASLGLGFDITPKIAMTAAIQPLVNLVTKEISRNSVNGTVSYNLFGSSRRYGATSDLGSIVYHGGNALSLLARGGVQYYQQYLKEVGSELKGSTINGMVGAAYRFDVDESQALGLEVLTTAVSFANSTEGLSTKELEFGLFYQYSL
jgi:hypothetical protein